MTVIWGAAERVQVNQRLLIDKILTRYSSEFVIYRELMQNSDDARSSSIQIIFETASYKKNDMTKDRIIFKNNGLAFNPDDWDRLKKIAEGNPDQQKIGAFGVGFYSLFSVCEEPFVSSGGRVMAFSYRGDELFVNPGQTNDDNEGWTKFLMKTKTPMEFPTVEKFARFLANSLAFTGNLREVSVYFNDTLVIKLSKRIEEPVPMNITSAGFDATSPQKLFKLTSVDVEDVQLDVERLIVPSNLSTSQLSRQLQFYYYSYETEKTSISLRIANGNLDFNISDEISTEMERITKKRPPSKTVIQMILTRFGNHRGHDSPVFEDLLPYPEQGRVYIGFTTHQTTGCCSHLAARVIPTMMRDNVDLAEKTLAIYNGEMLRIAGTLCRILYEDEMAEITRFYNHHYCDWLETRAAHVLTHFTFNPSTPNAEVGRMTELQFFNCSKKALSVLSTKGVLPISDVRILNPEMAGFIKHVPVIPNVIWRQCYTFFIKAKDMKLIRELNLQDVLLELRSRVLSEDETIELFRWWISYRSRGNIVNRSEFTQFMELSRVGDKSQALNTIRYFLNPGVIPPDADIPDGVLPYNISRKFIKQDFEKWFEWAELSLVNWARFIVKKPDLESNPSFSTKILTILAKGLNNITKSDKEIIRNLLIQKRCIPTKLGMKIPNEAYFQEVNLFSDLPTVQFQKPSYVKDLMELLGVRKIIEIKIIINRLINQENCNYMQIVKYLASISSELDKNDKKILRSESIWPKEDPEDKPSTKIQRFIISELHVPSTLHRDFDLPLIHWKRWWSSKSPEEKFLIELGLREFPTLERILKLAAPPIRYPSLYLFTSIKSQINYELCEKALKYLIDNFGGKYSKDYSSDKVDVKFLPCSDQNTYAKPSECFINRECEAMKFKVIRQDLQFQVAKLGVYPHPSREKLLNRLRDDRPQNEDEARNVFEYLTSQQGKFNQSDWKILSNLEFIPIKKKYSNEITHIKPCSCFFKIPNDMNMLSGFFSCVNFGDKANKFLQSCNVKNEPTPVEFAELLINSSVEVMNSIGVENYLTVLRRIAADFKYYRTISSKYDLVAKMKEARILIAIKKEYPNSGMNDGVNNKNGVNNYSLASAKQIYINDDIIYQRLFNPLTAPEDDNLEILYKELGCKSLHESVIETSSPCDYPSPKESKDSRELENKILERVRTFYYEFPKDKVKRDGKWLEKLKVKETSYIKTYYTFENTTIEKFTNTCITKDKYGNSWALYITTSSFAKLDYLEIAQHIAKNIYKSCKWKDIFNVHTLLVVPLSTLENMGYPVDRVNRQRESEETFESIKESVKESVIETEREEAKYSQMLQEIIKERAYLFYHNRPESKIKNDENWLKKLKVEESENDVTDILQHKVTGSWILYITSDSSLFDISECIAKNIYKSYEQKDILILNLLLSAPLSRLKNMGYPVKGHSLIGDATSSTTTVNESESQTNYCDIKSEHSLSHVETRQEIKLHDTKNKSSYQLGILSSSHAAPLNRFIDILKDLAKVCELQSKLQNRVNIFYDSNSDTVAFNLNGELFFNLKYYIKFHDEKCKSKPTIVALTYWYMTFCHELAHDHTKDHNSVHEHYFSSYAEVYMTNFLALIEKHGLLKHTTSNAYEIRHRRRDRTDRIRNLTGFGLTLPTPEAPTFGHYQDPPTGLNFPTYKSSATPTLRPYQTTETSLVDTYPPYPFESKKDDDPFSFNSIFKK